MPENAWYPAKSLAEIADELRLLARDQREQGTTLSLRAGESPEASWGITLTAMELSKLGTTMLHEALVAERMARQIEAHCVPAEHHKDWPHDADNY